VADLKDHPILLLEGSLTVSEFCRLERISKPKCYALWKRGLGPKFYIVGGQRRISRKSHLEWREGLEAAENEQKPGHISQRLAKNKNSNINQ
jgi:hypothetical protein